MKMILRNNLIYQRQVSAESFFQENTNTPICRLTQTPTNYIGLSTGPNKLRCCTVQNKSTFSSVHNYRSHSSFRQGF